ncbi:MAG: hypothetical protein WCD54_24580, partial [Pseudolabrys sp.]
AWAAVLMLIATTMMLLRNKFFTASPERDRAILGCRALKPNLLPSAVTYRARQAIIFHKALTGQHSTTGLMDCRSN